MRKELEKRINELAAWAHQMVDEEMPIKEDTPHDSFGRGKVLSEIEHILARGFRYRRCFGAHGRIKSIVDGAITLEDSDLIWSYMVGQCLRASTGDGSEASHQYKDGTYEVYWVDLDKRCFGVASTEGLEVGDYLFLVPNPRFAAVTKESE